MLSIPKDSLKKRYCSLWEHGSMNITIRKATVNDAREVVDVINAVIAEGKHTIFDKPFSEEEERSFIASLGNRSALYVAESEGEIVLRQLDLDRKLSLCNSRCQA